MESDSGRILYVLDGSSYLYRAHFSTQRELTSSDGIPTRAVFVLTKMILKILNEKQPEYMMVAWDAKGPTFRHEIYEEYKANRPPMPEELEIQLPYVKRIIDALGIAQMEFEGYEADDIMATVARQVSRHRDLTLVLVTGDKDMRQLISDSVILWEPMKDEITDLDAFRREFEIEPVRYVDVLALQGDTADNIPGVPGIGPKTALKLIREHGSVEALLKDLPSIKKGKLKERLLENKDVILLWKRLVQLDDNVPLNMDLDDMKVREPDKQVLFQIFKELDFESLIPMVSDGKVLSHEHYGLITSIEEFRKWLKGVGSWNELVVDTETTSERPMLARLVGISLCIRPPDAIYIPIGHDGYELDKEELDALLDELSRVFRDQTKKKTGQNIKYDLMVLSRHGMPMENIAGDTMIASYLLDPTKRRHNLDEISRDVLGHKMISYKEVTKGLKRGEDFSKVPVMKAMEYACEDVHVTCLVRDRFHEMLKDKGLWRLYSEVEIPLVPVLADMEMNGVLIDRKMLKELKDEFGGRLAQLEEEIYSLAGNKFNINSTRQLAEILFGKLGLPEVKKTRKRTGLSTDVEVLKSLAELHPLPGMLLSFRNLSKLKSTYIDGLEKEINPETGRVHTSFNQTVTATGRLSSSNPNLQNIPIRTEEGRKIRALFIADEGNVLVSADYSQIDLRVLAHYSRDEHLVEAFKNDEDIHRRTAAQIFDVAPEFVTSDMRRVAKTVNFGIIYGMSAFGLAKELNIGRKEAQGFIDAYFKRYPGVRRYMEKTIESARKNGYVETILGRRRYIKEINARTRSIRQFAERTAINTPIQGSAADIIKLAMIEVFERLASRVPDARLILQVHDELVVECPADRQELVASELKDTMENIVQLAVPLKVSVGIGKNWSELK